MAIRTTMTATPTTLIAVGGKRKFEGGDDKEYTPVKKNGVTKEESNNGTEIKQEVISLDAGKPSILPS